MNEAVWELRWVHITVSLPNIIPVHHGDTLTVDTKKAGMSFDHNMPVKDSAPLALVEAQWLTSVQQMDDTGPRGSSSGLWIWWLPLCTQTVSIEIPWADTHLSLKNNNNTGRRCERRASSLIVFKSKEHQILPQLAHNSLYSNLLHHVTHTYIPNIRFFYGKGFYVFQF